MKELGDAFSITFKVAGNSYLIEPIKNNNELEQKEIHLLSARPDEINLRGVEYKKFTERGTIAGEYPLIYLNYRKI